MSILVDTLPLLHQCLVAISPPAIPLNQVSLAIDLEGIDLCRHGVVSILQIMSNLSNTVWIVDITVLGQEAFDYLPSDGRSLRAILESANIKKVIYDVRNDADALLHIHRVGMKGVYDLQLLELAVRHFLNRPTEFLNGLSRSIEGYITAPRDWKAIKDAGIALFNPEKGGSYSVFEKRPLDPRILAYCVQDVTQLFKLETALRRILGGGEKAWDRRVIAASAARVLEVRSSSYQPHGRHKALAPAI